MIFNSKIDRYLYRVLQLLLIAVTVTPLVFYKYYYYPFVTGKVLAFRMLIFLALIVFGIYIIRLKKIKYFISPIWWFFFGLLAVSFLSAIFGVNFERSFWSSIERSDGLVFLIYLFVYFSLMVFAFREFKDWKWLLRTSLATSLAVIGYGILQHFGLFEAINTTGARVSSTLGNPAYLGSYALMNVFLSWYLMGRDRQLAWRIFYGASLVLNFWVIFLTQTRGAAVGLVGGLGLLGILTIFRHQDKRVVKMGIWGLIALILIVVLTFIFKDSALISGNQTLNRVTSISFESYTVRTRLAAWGASFKAFKDRPVLGWGGENYGYAFSKYFPPEIYTDSGSRIWFDKAHSVFFEYLVTTGVIGVLTYFGLLFLVIYHLFRSRRIKKMTGNIFISLVVGYTLANMFVFDTLSTYIIFAIILAWVNNTAFMAEYKGREINFNFWQMGILMLVGILFVYWSWILNWQAIGYNKDLLFAEAYAMEGETQTAFELYTLALDGNDGFSRHEIAIQLAIFTRGQAGTLKDYEAVAMFDRAIEEVEKSIEKDPYEVRYYYNLSQLYLSSYKYDRSRLNGVIDMGDKMIELAPRRAHTYYQIGEAHVLNGEYDQALENFQKAVELNPKVIDAYVNVYAAAVLKGDTELEETTRIRMEELDPEYFSGEQALLRYIPLYKQAGLGERVVESLEKLISLFPEKIEYVSSLAIYYAEQGKNQQAEETVRRLSGLSPELDIEIEKFIGQIRVGDFLIN